MTTLNFALDAQKYTKCRALLWGNCAGHFQKAFGAEAMSGGRRFVHFLIAVIELVPVIGQVASLFERAIVKGALKIETTKTEKTEKTEENEKPKINPIINSEKKQIIKEHAEQDNICIERINCFEVEIPGLSVHEFPKESLSIMECPLSFNNFMHPYIFLEECSSYEHNALVEELSRKIDTKKDESPFLQGIESDSKCGAIITYTKATIAPNYILKMENPVCPITGEAFKEPYFCLENGQTYEKLAIENWFNKQNKCQKLTLYPNIALFIFVKEKDKEQKGRDALVLEKK